MARPASIIVASWRVKTTRSCRATLPPAGLALLADLFLDGNDQKIAVEQGGDGRLFGGRFDRIADFPARGCFPRNVDE